MAIAARVRTTRPVFPSRRAAHAKPHRGRRSECSARLAGAACAVFLFGARPAAAQVNARLFEPSVDPQGGVYLEPAPTPGHGNFNGGAWMRYAFRPVSIRAPDGSVVARPFDHQLSTDLIADFGIGSRGALGFDFPFVLFQDGTSEVVNFATASGGSPLKAPPTKKTALVDAAFVGKLNLVGYGDLGGFGLSLLARQTVPTGADDSFVGEGSAKSELRALAEYKLLALSVQATTGFTLRTQERIVGSEGFRHSIPWGIGATLRPQALGIDENGHWTWGLELHGAIMLAPSSEARAQGASTPTSPVLADLSARYAFGALSVIGALESSFTHALGAPPFAAMIGIGWAPRVHDIDNDGIPDDVDQCPELPEDRDGVEDEDGCPDFDPSGK